MKNIIIAAVVIVLFGIGGYFLFQSSFFEGRVINSPDLANNLTPVIPGVPSGDGQGGETPGEAVNKAETVIGKSVEGREITAYHYGTGPKEILLVGGIHGGYEWNTALVAYEAMDYFKANLGVIPSQIKVTVIPVLNPDGLNKTVGTAGRFAKADVPATLAETVSGRFNANEVDLNRNFDCDWQASATWQNKTVSGGTGPFSEPEARAIRDYVTTNRPVAVLVWYSSANGVFASSCHDGVLPETLVLTAAYARASGYPPYEDFNFYEITGDLVNWLAKEKIPAISVLLATHDEVEWSKNQAGLKALLEYYGK